MRLPIALWFARNQKLAFALERSELERQALDARLHLLQAQIAPHFLFNTLANVQALVDAGSPQAPVVLRSLTAYLRAAVPLLHESTATIERELQLVRPYLELMQLRMPDRLQYALNVDPASSWTRLIDAFALTVAIVLGVGCALSGVRLINTPGHDAAGVPFRTAGVVSLITAAVLAIAAAGDVRTMRFGRPRGGPRLARHLWRMCFALLIAAASFFSIRERVAQVLPEPFTTGPMRALPILLLLGAMFYWLWRVRARRRLPALVRHDSVPLAARAKHTGSF